MSSYRIIIPSRKRSHIIKVVKGLLPDASVLVRHEETADYARVLGRDCVLSLPEGFRGGITGIRQWVLDNIEGDVFMCDDDLKEVFCIVGNTRRVYRDAETVKQVIDNAYQCALDAGTGLFYFNRDSKPMFFKSNDPFAFCGGFAGGAFGIIGRKLRFDTNMTTREDVDLTLQALLVYRFVFTDKRWYFNFGGTWKGEGGNQGIRTTDNELKDAQYLKKKWGKWIDTAVTREFLTKGGIKNVTGTRITVKRRQEI